MKKLLLVCLVSFIGKHAFTQANDNDNSVNIIPAPVSLTVHTGKFSLKPDTKILYNNKNMEDIALLFGQILSKPTGYHFIPEKTDTKPRNAISLLLNTKKDTLIGDEGYSLSITSGKIFIKANTEQGIFYGIQSLMQLLPPQVEADTITKNTAWDIDCVDIIDYPRFRWRGIMVDESRHFFGKKAIEQFINEMAKYKYNVFHWHLTDDQGWRIEIKGLPRLTEIGAWRVPRTGKWGTLPPPQPGEKATDGGFYTQDEIKEIVRYAKDRNITVLPEIDVPAHCLGADSIVSCALRFANDLSRVASIRAGQHRQCPGCCRRFYMVDIG